ADCVLPSTELYALYPSRRYQSMKVKTFIDYLLEQLEQRVKDRVETTDDPLVKLPTTSLTHPACPAVVIEIFHDRAYPYCSVTDRRPPRRHRLHCPVQSVLRSPARRSVHPAYRGYRPGALQCRIGKADPRLPALAGAGLGRGPGCWRSPWPLSPERAQRDLPGTQRAAD